jgi:integrase
MDPVLTRYPSNSASGGSLRSHHSVTRRHWPDRGGSRGEGPRLRLLSRARGCDGSSAGELCALRWNDLNLKAGTLTIARSVVGQRNDDLVEKGTKTHSSRRISLDPATLSSLIAQRDRHEARAEEFGVRLPSKAFVFSDSADCTTPWRPNRVTLAFRRICDGLDVPNVRLHDLRHFAATRLLAAGVPVKTVSGRLGHANAATTLNVYAHFLESSDETAAQVLGDLLDGPPKGKEPRRVTAPSH